MSKLILIDPETSEPIQEYPLVPGELSIGRGENNDIIIDTASASFHHASIFTEKNDSFVHDRGSTNGTYVNGKKVRNHVLENKDVINIGSRILLYIFSKDTHHKREASAKLLVLKGHNKGQQIILKSAVTTLGQPGVQFAAISYRQQQYYFSHIDGGDTLEYCLINGKPTGYEPVKLNFGDIITINQTELEMSPIPPAIQKPLV